MRRVLGIALLAALLAAGSVLGGSAVAGTAAASPRLGVVPGTWTIVASPNTAQNLNTLNGVSCLTSSFCMSVGNAGTTNPGQALIQQWNGTSWTILASPTVTGATASTLIGVSCVTTSYCVAVGTATVSGTPQTLVDQWNGMAWSVVTSPNTSTSIPNRLTAVSCTSLTVCTAVGIAGNKALAVQWNGSNWAIVPTATPSPTSVDLLSGVACKSASWCYAVGNTSAGGPTQPLAELWNGATWAVVSTPNPIGGGGLSGVACPSATFCVAVGQGNAPVANLIEQWNGTAWTIATGPTSAMGTGLIGVSCVGPSSCVAVGVSLPAAGSLTQALAWNGATWVAQTTPNPPVTPVATDQATLNDVSCVGGQSCWAVGSAVPDSTLTGHKTLVESAPITRPGYRFVASDGGVFDFGGAVFYGSTGGMTLNKPVVGMAVNPDGAGYWLVASDGGIFTFGSALFHGSTGSLILNKPIVGMATTPDGGGYWLVASDGGIFTFGNAVFQGSTGALKLNKPIVGMTA